MVKGASKRDVLILTALRYLFLPCIWFHLHVFYVIVVCNLKMKIIYMYRTSAIISHDLYLFNPLFAVQSRLSNTLELEWNSLHAQKRSNTEFAIL
jgi:hypothetical protein